MTGSTNGFSVFVAAALGLLLAAEEGGSPGAWQELRVPDLVPVSLTRTRGGLSSPPSTPVTVRVVVENASAYDLPGPAAARWTVRIQGYVHNPYYVQRALRAGEQYSFTLAVAVPCGKVTDLEVWVNSRRSVVESDFDNNRASFPVQGNACPEAQRAG